MHICSLILILKILHRFVQFSLFSPILDQQFYSDVSYICMSKNTVMENVMASSACVSRKLEMKSAL